MKRKLSFSLFNLLDETQGEVVKLQALAKGLFASVTGLTYFINSPDAAIIAGMLSAFIIELFGCIKIEYENS